MKNTQTFLQHSLACITPCNHELQRTAMEHLDNLTKPRGSLGLLEAVARRLYCIQGGAQKLRTEKAFMFTVAADHGIAAENVSSYPQEVTRQMVLNFLNEGAAINVLCKLNNIDFAVVDAGCVGGAFQPHKLLLDRRLGEGSRNFAKEAAMSRETCITALVHGIELADMATEKDYDIIALGEMGISNTTSATALFCALFDLAPALITGPGAGADQSLLAHKVKVIEHALSLHSATLKDGDAIDLLATLGGFEIAVLAGIALGAAKNKRVLMVDGFIATAAFAVAANICKTVEDYALLAHTSAEPGYVHVLSALERQGFSHPPLLQLGMRLGEGTGAALAINLVRAAASIYNDMATFTSANISDQTS